MNDKQVKHSDCRNFIGVDVAKGICGATNDTVLIDSEVCATFVMLKKCKNCGHFTLGTEKTLGRCTGFAKPDWVYEDLIAEQCEQYSPCKKAGVGGQ
jgi:4-hydroxyphenylacetate decarboxylase small subunit